MNPREIFEATLRFQPVERPFFMPAIGFWNETLARWRGEGLPWYIRDPVTPLLHFGFDLWVPLPLGSFAGAGLLPPFMPRVLERTGRYRIARDFNGNVFKKFTDGSSSIPEFIEAPVRNMDDFEALKWRLEPGFPGRCANPLFDGLARFARVRKQPLVIMACGLFGFHRHLLGDEELMVAYYDQPELIHEISRTWERLHAEALRRVCGRYAVSMVSFWEDMCYRGGPLISPKTFREFMTPYYKSVIDAGRGQGQEFFGVDTDGDCSLVIPLFEEVGVNMMYPFEVQAGMDILEVRKKHPSLVIYGGLDKRALARDRAAIESEVMARVPAMMALGGYMPGLDHAVPPDVPLENFRRFLELMKSPALMDRLSE